MATTYKLIIEDRTRDKRVLKAVDSVSVPKGAGKTSKNIVGAEANRYMRPINSVMNKLTNGYWEQGTRLAKASASMVSVGSSKGVGGAFASVGFMIIIQYIIMQLMKWWEKEKQKNLAENNANFLKIQSGQTTLLENYRVAKNTFMRNINYSNQ